MLSVQICRRDPRQVGPSRPELSSHYRVETTHNSSVFPGLKPRLAAVTHARWIQRGHSSARLVQFSCTFEIPFVLRFCFCSVLVFCTAIHTHAHVSWWSI